MSFDDLIFYLPGYVSIPLVMAGMLAMWLVWRLVRRRKSPPRLQKKDGQEVSKP